MGGSVADAMAGNNVIIGAAGGHVTVFLVVTDTDAAGQGPVRHYQMKLMCDAIALAGATGAVTHDENGPTPCGTPPLSSPCVDMSNQDYIFAGLLALSAGMDPCPRGMPVSDSALIHASDAQACGPAQACYLTEFSYAISLDATGDHGVTIQKPWEVGIGGDSFIFAEPLASILFAIDDPGAIIRIPTGACCDDVGCIADGINETACDALGGSFTEGAVCNTQCLYGDITSPAGLCIPDCTGEENDIDFDDILCAVNGFANASDCPCADIAGAVETPCIPDGIIDFDDILSIINAFLGNPPCPDPCSHDG